MAVPAANGGWPAWMARLGVALVLLPLVPGLLWILWPALSPGVWRQLLGEGQLPAALQVSIFSAVGSTLLALLLAWALAVVLYPGIGWRRLQGQLPLLLAFPHVAFAVGLGFLLAPSGWLARLLAALFGWLSPPQWVTVQDPHGLSLLLALALKECWFLLWALAALLGEQGIQRQWVVAASLGYGRRQLWRYILLPQLLPHLGWPLVAVLAYGLSVVDMALILGPSTPPTLAVLGWQWLSDPRPEQQALGSAVAVVLLGLLALLIGLGAGLWQLWRRCRRYPRGRRRRSAGAGVMGLLPWLVIVPGWAALLLLALWSLARGWFFPALWPSQLSALHWLNADLEPLLITLALAGGAILLALPLALLWLEWGPRRYQGWLYAPLILPALPLAAAQYGVLLHLRLDGRLVGVIWSHLAWVLPYMILLLTGPYRAFDERLLLTARALGHSRWQACLAVKWPLLLRPILAAVAVGFAVSVAQYLPTLFAGAGRFSSVTTEAVALSAGGNRSVLAVQSLLQTVLPLLAFGLAAWWPRWRARHRRGLA